MRHFVYTYSEHTPRGGHCHKTVSLYRIVRNEPRFVGTLTDTFVDKNQLVMMVAEHFKALPKPVFNRHQFGGYANTPWSLKQDRIASFTEL